jgi:hypothetical protein
MLFTTKWFYARIHNLDLSRPIPSFPRRGTCSQTLPPTAVRKLFLIALRDIYLTLPTFRSNWHRSWHCAFLVIFNHFYIFQT